MEISGIVKKIFEEKSFSSGFRKRDIVLTTQEQYPQDLLIDFLQDKVELVQGLKEGEEVTIGINLRGREWTSPDGAVKYFNSITAWRVQKNNLASATTGKENIKETSIDSTPRDFTKDPDEVDDLPF